MNNPNFIDAAIESLRAHNEHERDPEDAAQVSKFVAGLRGIKAKRAKERDAAMGIGPKEKHVRRASGAY